MSKEGLPENQVGAAVLYREITEEGARISLRTGEILATSALNNRCFKTTLIAMKIPPTELFGAAKVDSEEQRDILKIAPQNVLRRIDELAGRTVVRQVIEEARSLARDMSLNGDRDSVFAKLREVEDSYFQNGDPRFNRSIPSLRRAEHGLA